MKTKLMMTNVTSTASLDFVTILSHAAAALRDPRSDCPSAKAVVNALVQAEKAAKQQ